MQLPLQWTNCLRRSVLIQAILEQRGERVSAAIMCAVPAIQVTGLPQGGMHLTLTFPPRSPPFSSPHPAGVPGGSCEVRCRLDLVGPAPEPRLWLQVGSERVQRSCPLTPSLLPACLHACGMPCCRPPVLDWQEFDPSL